MGYVSEAKIILEAKIARDLQRYSSLNHLEEEMLRNIPRQGFAVAQQRIHLVDEMEALGERIRRSRLMLTSARS